MTVCTADEHEQWTNARTAAGESFGVYHIAVAAESDLNGPSYSPQVKARIEHPGSNDGQPSARAKYAGVSAERVFDAAADWLLSLFSKPYLPDLTLDHARAWRSISAEQCQVFFTNRITSLLQSAGSLSPTAFRVGIAILNRLPEHTPPEEYVATLAELDDSYELVGKGGQFGRLRERERAIERTIRHRCGFTARYGCEVPDPAPEFVDEDLIALKERLDATRQEIKEQNAEITALSGDLRTYRDRWQTTVRDRLDGLLADLEAGAEKDLDVIAEAGQCPVCEQVSRTDHDSAASCEDCMVESPSIDVSWRVDPSEEP